MPVINHICFIDSFWLGVLLHTVIIATIVIGVEGIKWRKFNLLGLKDLGLKWVEKEALEIKADYDSNIPLKPMSEQTLLMHVTKWSEMIQADHTAKMTLTGFIITILAALVGFQGEYTFTTGQLWLLTAAALSLFFQAALLLWVIRNDREAMYQYTTSSQGRDLKRIKLSVLDGRLNPILQKTILVSLLLVIALIGHRVYGQSLTSRSNQIQAERLQQEVAQLKSENSQLDAKTNSLFDISQHNSNLLQDILSQAEGGLMKTYAMSQGALLEIRKLATQRQEP